MAYFTTWRAKIISVMLIAVMYNDWQETKHGLYKQFTFRDFKEAFAFMTRVAALAEEQGHHPRWENEWSVVQIWLITHDQQATVTDKDRRLADSIDGLLKKGILVDQWAVPAPESVEEKATKKVKMYSDGGSRGNPGPSASGYVVLDMDDKILDTGSRYLGVTTNNIAEYTGLKIGLEAALKLGAREVDVYMDSLLVVNQMKRIFKIKNRDLWPLHDAVCDLVPRFKRVTFTHVPREFNKLADAEVNKSMDEHLANNK
ncbi:reverse transcriptase-like protein [Candidatus Saccharibacteria bacterium]|nr:reverse transcriptase-like protein [Candidatus Saccharibacteria bacterium]